MENIYPISLSREAPHLDSSPLVGGISACLPPGKERSPPLLHLISTGPYHWDGRTTPIPSPPSCSCLYLEPHLTITPDHSQPFSLLTWEMPLVTRGDCQISLGPATPATGSASAFCRWRFHHGPRSLAIHHASREGGSPEQVSVQRATAHHAGRVGFWVGVGGDPGWVSLPGIRFPGWVSCPGPSAGGTHTPWGGGWGCQSLEDFLPASHLTLIPSSHTLFSYLVWVPFPSPIKWGLCNFGWSADFLRWGRVTRLPGCPQMPFTAPLLGECLPVQIL